MAGNLLGRVSLVYIAIMLPIIQGGDETPVMETARLYGSIYGYAYYFVDLLVGSPYPQRQSVILDTGSTILAFPCKSCDHCGTHIDDPFDFANSTTAAWENCTASCTCRHERCSYYQGYTEGSSIRGSWFSDWIMLGDLGSNNEAVMAHAGCHDEETNLFSTQKASGILGVAPRHGSEHETLVETLFKNSPVNHKVFSICLAPRGGALTVGGFNTSYHDSKAEIIWTPMSNDHYYSVTLEDATLGGKSVGTGEAWGNVIIDSGTTFTYLPPDIWTQFNKKFQAICADEGKCKGTHEKKEDECWEIADIADLDSFPEIMMTFAGNKAMPWKPRSYLFQRFPDKKWCLGIDNNHKRATVLGMSFMQNNDIVMDRARKLVGMVQATCPEHTDRPPPPNHVPARLPAKTDYGLGDKAKPSSIPAAVSGGTSLKNKVYPKPPAAEIIPPHHVDEVLEPNNRKGEGKKHSGNLGIWTATTIALLAIILAMLVIVRQTIKSRNTGYATMDSQQQLEDEEEALREVQLSNYRGDYPGDVGFELEEEDDDDEDDSTEDDFDFKIRPKNIGKPVVI